MKRSKYILRSLLYFKKQHLSLLLGTVISTAVLTGALIVGDSVTHSLEQLTQKRLGKIAYALESGERYVSDDLSHAIEESEGIRAAALLHIDAMVIEAEKDIRVQSASLYGIDSSFCYFSSLPPESVTEEALMISENVASRLNVEVGQELLIKFWDPDALPLQSLFAQEEVKYLSLRLAVSRILTDEELGRFSLRTDQKAPYNLFVHKALLQDKSELQHRSNLLVFQSGARSQGDWEQVLKKSLKAEDASLVIRSMEGGSPEIEVTSERVFIDESIVDTLGKHGADKILTYLVNGIQNETRQTPYSFVSGLSSELLPYPLKEDEIILNDWCANDLGVQRGDSVSLTYFSIDAFRKLNTEYKRFLVKGIEQNQGALFCRDLMPDFPGLSDAKSCSEWDTGLPIDLDKIRDKDEKYWEDFKGTPKAIVSYKSAAEIWANQYGNATALRLPRSELEKLENNFGALVSPGVIGLKVKEVKNAGLQAASNGVDFGELFLSLSFFVILSGVLLLVLLYSFNLLSRRKEIEKLRALGLSRKSIFSLFFYEILIPLTVGNVLGVVLGIFYNRAILYGLNGLWQDAVRTRALEVFIEPMSLLTGLVVGIISFSSDRIPGFEKNAAEEKHLF
jgi:putative ABC transport system permease protein